MTRSRSRLRLVMTATAADGSFESMVLSSSTRCLSIDDVFSPVMTSSLRGLSSTSIFPFVSVFLYFLFPAVSLTRRSLCSSPS